MQPIPPARSASPIARTYAALQAIFPLVGPLAGAAVALFLAGQLLGALSPHLARLLPAPVPAAAPAGSPLTMSPRSATSPGSATAAISPTLAAASGGAAGALESLLSGRHALLRDASGAWPRRGVIERFRLDAPPRVLPVSSAGMLLAADSRDSSALLAADAARALLGHESRSVQVVDARLVDARLVIARHLGPEQPGSSVDAGVAATEETVIAERPAWLVFLRADPVEPPGWTDAVPPRTLVELLVLDAATGSLLLRPTAALADDFEAVQRSRHPAADPTRPLGYFGDPAP